MNGFGLQPGMLGGVLTAAPLIDAGKFNDFEWDAPYETELEGEVFNVMDYGADPLGYADSTPAFTICWSAAADWQDDNPGEVATFYMPEGTYKLIPPGNDTAASWILMIHHSHLRVVGDGPDKTLLRMRATLDRDPNSGMVYKRGGLFTTYGVSPSPSEANPLRDIKIRGFRACGGARATMGAGGDWYGGGSFNGWDGTHKPFAVFNIWCNDISIDDCEFDGWRGETLYSGGGYELGSFNVSSCLIRECNASALSMGGKVTVRDTKVRSSYNAMECFAFGLGQYLDVEGCDIKPKGDAGDRYVLGKFGVVFLGLTTAHLRCWNNEFGDTIYGAIFGSESMSNFSCLYNTFEDTTAVYCMFLNLYPDEGFPPDQEDQWNNWDIRFNTFKATNRNVEYVISGPGAGWGRNRLISNNEVINTAPYKYSALVLNGGALGDYRVENNIIPNGTNLISGGGGYTTVNRPFGSETNIVSGQFANGTNYTDTLGASTDPLVVSPHWARTQVVYVSGEVASRRVIPGEMGAYPDGFVWELRRTGEAAWARFLRVEPGDWNHLSANVDIYEGDVLTQQWSILDQKFSEALTIKTTEVYKTVGSVDLELDIHKPIAFGALRTAVIFVHGGGWTAGTRANHDAHARYFARTGRVGINISYRLVSDDVDLFDQVADVRAAIRWVRENASAYGINRHDIAICGESAGGHLAAVAAFVDAFDDLGGNQSVSSRPNRAVLLNPITYLPGIPWYEGHAAQVGATPVPDDDTQLTPASTGADASLRLSPMLYSDITGQPDVLFIHGDVDSVVPFAQSQDMHELLVLAGNNSTLETMVGSNHSFPLPGIGTNAELKTTVELIDAFLVPLGSGDDDSEYHVFMVAGQSNAGGFTGLGDYLETGGELPPGRDVPIPASPSDTTFFYHSGDDVVYDVADYPFVNGYIMVLSGSGEITGEYGGKRAGLHAQFAATYFAETGKKVLFVQCLAGNSGILPGINFGGGNWTTAESNNGGDGSSYADQMQAKWAAFKAHAATEALSYDFRGIIWCQGEADNGYLLEDVIEARENLFDRFATDYLADLSDALEGKLIHCVLASVPGGDTPDNIPPDEQTWHENREGQRIVAATHPNAHMAFGQTERFLFDGEGFPNCFWNLGYRGNEGQQNYLHFDQSQYNEMGEVLALTLSGSPPAAPAPDVITGLTATADGYLRIRVEWDDPTLGVGSEVKEVRVYRRVSGDTDWKEVYHFSNLAGYDPAVVLYYDEFELTDAVEYEYRIGHRNEFSEAYSSVVEVTAEGPGTGIALGLIEWWEDASVTGSYAGHTLSASPEYTEVGPTGLDAWIGSGAAITSSPGILLQSNRNTSVATIAWVGRVTGSINATNVIAELGSAYPAQQVGVFNSGEGLSVRNGDSTIYKGLPINEWNSVVIVMSGRSWDVYINGVLEGTVANAGIAGGGVSIYTLFGGQDYHLQHLIVAISGRAWNTGDVAAFHNGGDFVKYADL